MSNSILSVVNHPHPTLEIYQTLLDVTEGTRTDISFLGWRYVQSNGYEGVVSLETLANRVAELSRTHFDTSETERVAGKSIASRISQLFKASDEKLKQKWWLTKVLCSLRDIHFDIFGGTESMQGEWYIPQFCLYTRDQWITKFGKAPTGRSCEINPERWFPEE